MFDRAQMPTTKMSDKAIRRSNGTAGTASIYVDASPTPVEARPVPWIYTTPSIEEEQPPPPLIYYPEKPPPAATATIVDLDCETVVSGASLEQRTPRPVCIVISGSSTDTAVIPATAGKENAQKGVTTTRTMIRPMRNDVVNRSTVVESGQWYLATSQAKYCDSGGGGLA